MVSEKFSSKNSKFYSECMAHKLFYHTAISQFLTADISFNIACKELKIAQITQRNPLFQLLLLVHTQLFRERLSEKMCTRQSRKVIIIRYEQYTVPDIVAVESTFVAFLYHSQTYVHGLSCHSFKFLWRTVNSKPPTIPFGIVACTFSDSLSRNSCLRPATDLWVKSYANEEKVNNDVSKDSPIEGTSYLGGEGGVSHGTLWDYLLRVLDSS